MELKKFKKILKEECITGKEVAVMIGITYGSYRVATMSSSLITPKWVTSFVAAYELSNK
mgnify:CR=1 FL=1|tara:strand:- start:383 stop:559 length:177 start_codon:yes stop_codon:yes gene_type:complete